MLFFVGVNDGLIPRHDAGGGILSEYDREELERALDVAASYDRRVLVEVGVVHPVEINCAALGYGEEVQTSVCEMPIPSSNDTFLDFWQKYLRNASTKGEESRGMMSLSRAVPAPIGEELTKRIQTMTAEIFKLMDCCGTIRVDYILDQNDVLFAEVIQTIVDEFGYSEETARRFHQDMLYFTYGLAILANTDHLHLSETELREAFRREFRALISLYGKPVKLPEFAVKAGLVL